MPRATFALDVSADGGIGAADAGEQQAEVVVDLRGGGHSTAGVLDIHLLLYGDGRRDAVDGLHVGFGHASQELARIGGQAFGKAALPFGKQGVEGQGTFSAAGYSGNDNQTIAGNLHRNVLEVVHPGVPDYYVSFGWHVSSVTFSNSSEGM